MKLLLIAAFASILVSAQTNAEPYIMAGPTWARGGDMSLAPGAGYQFSRNFAVEASYANLGDRETFAQRPSAPLTTLVTWKRKSREGARLALLGMLPMSERFSLLGSVGAYRLKSETLESDVFTAAFTSATVGSRTRNETKTVGALGLGASYDVMKQVALRAIVERVDDERVVSLSLVKRF